ncbi:MAG: mechanosensitive ion channel [Bacteroidetes bacterium]|jgi:small conductance mechanosensitive channel|nr:mechanosensitive ion channel [Bacteroidota bacterium]
MEKDLNYYLNHALDVAIQEGPRILFALLLLIVGLKVIRVLSRRLVGVMGKNSLDENVRPFLRNVFSWLLKLVLIISVAGMLGINTSSFLAVLGTVGLAIGLAVKDSLANVAGGVMLLTLKPFQKNDTVEIQGKVGKVQEIRMLHTLLLTVDNKAIIIPNGGIVNSAIINYTQEKMRRVDISLRISYQSDLKLAKEIASERIQCHPLVLQDPASFVGVSALGANSIELTLRAWAKTEDHGAVFHELIESIKVAYDERSIEIV